MINSVKRDARINRGEVDEIRETARWDRIMVQVDSGAIDTVGQKEIPKAFEMKETMMSKRGIGFAAANGSGIKNYGEKRIIGYTENGEEVSLRIQCADVKKVLGLVHKMGMGGNVVVLDGER